jgi:hypothetical protein
MTPEEMLHTVFQQPGAYLYPFGSAPLGAVERMSDARLRRLGWPHLACAWAQ